METETTQIDNIPRDVWASARRFLRPGQLDAPHEISDIVEAILYLESASFVTGEILHVDGGQSAGYWPCRSISR
jgi:NAD(P)-dependent dehydrogenase (short-subunit alcohol dehydrogenase family)